MNNFFWKIVIEIRSDMTTEDEACFNMNESLIKMSNGKTQWDVTSKNPSTYYESRLVLPDDLSCEHCVLQWRYHSGNSWGCDDTGCGLGLAMVQNLKKN